MGDLVVARRGLHAAALVANLLELSVDAFATSSFSASGIRRDRVADLMSLLR